MCQTPSSDRSTRGILSVLALLLAFIAGPHDAAAGVHVDAQCTVSIHDKIRAEDLAELQVLSCRPKAIVLNSTGGDPDAAMATGRWLRAQGYAVIVERQCLGSCALAYIGAVKRENWGQIGLFRPELSVPGPHAERQHAVAKKLDAIRAYVAEMGVRPAFAELLIGTPQAQMQSFWYRGGRSIEPLVPVIHDPEPGSVVLERAVVLKGKDPG
jgi:hypothetical protein